MDSSEKEVVITYETLFELLRLEKSRPELQKLSSTFFVDVLSYLKDKCMILQDDVQTSLFPSAEKEKTRRELENIGRILKEIYDRREKKLLDMAMIKSRTDVQIVDTSNMLEVEKELFETITDDLRLYRSANLVKLLNGEEPRSAFQQATQRTVSEGAEQEKTGATGGIEAATSSVTNPNIYKQEASQPEQQASDMTDLIQVVRFVSNVDEIVGPDLQIYGPFEPGATAELPKELARALVNNKQAQLL
ncbi:MAG: hypothetical protein KJ574_00810 [Nanoarchaeota archaeon]|nr:hypothetical protein [Nanoarchaeota archaeon]